MSNKIIDARGMRCPWPVLRLARAVREAEQGTSIIIVADDPIAPTEIAAFAHERSMIMSIVATEYGIGFHLTTEKSR